MKQFVAARSLLLVPCLWFGHASASAADPIKITMTAAKWHIEGESEFQQYKGVDALFLKSGVAIVNDLTFRDGTIEFDVEHTGEMGTGIGFRRRDRDTYEDFYLRPRPKCAESPHCVQYAPQTHGVLLWDLYPQYEAPAPLRDSEWNHLKLVVSRRRMNVFVNGAESPTLQVGRLEGDAAEGGLLLQGPGRFANLTVTPDAIEGLKATPELDPTADDSRFVRNWQIAPFYELPAGKEPSVPELSQRSLTWQTVAAEPRGLVNISRLYGKPFPSSSRGVTWLRTTIVSDNSQTKRTAIGWVREVWVFVNGQPVYADKNLFQPPSARKMPDGRCSLENGSFQLPLKEGNNEVAIAVADNFYGWGVILRLDDIEGVRLALAPEPEKTVRR